MAAERRNQRSEDPIEAAVLYLAAAAKRRSFQSLTLSRPDGAIIADAPTKLNSEALATIAQIAGPGDHPTDGLVDLITRGQPLRVWDVEIEGSRHYLSAVGTDELPPSEAEKALRRILC
tara:strand:+ start:71 stop:427 length:357 start_codon:yes stop_codon:yes gene_type:complete